MPHLKIQDGDFLEVIYKLKLVGLVVTSDKTWQEHVNYTVGRVNKVLWIFFISHHNLKNI